MTTMAYYNNIQHLMHRNAQTYKHAELQFPELLTIQHHCCGSCFVCVCVFVCVRCVLCVLGVRASSITHNSTNNTHTHTNTSTTQAQHNTNNQHTHSSTKQQQTTQPWILQIVRESVLHCCLCYSITCKYVCLYLFVPP